MAACARPGLRLDGFMSLLSTVSRWVPSFLVESWQLGSAQVGASPWVHTGWGVITHPSHTHAHTHACTALTHACTALTHTHRQAWTHTRTDTHAMRAHTHTSTQIHTHAHMHVCTHTRTYRQAHTQKTHTHTHTHAHTHRMELWLRATQNKIDMTFKLNPYLINIE